MNASKTLAKVIERMFPERVAEIRRTNDERRTAMQAMLKANHELRTNGHKAEYIDNKLHDAMRYYKRGNYQMCILCFPAK